MINAERLSFLETTILMKLINLIKMQLPEAVKIILFGSRAKGRSNEESDLDIAIVVDVELIDKKLWERIWDIKWRVLESIDAEFFPLSLMPLRLKDFINRDYGIESEIKREGIIIWERN